MIKRLLNLSFLLLAPALLNPSLFAETVFTPWGNVIGMRIGGELAEFEAGLRIVREDWSGFSSAVKYLQRPKYSRVGRQRTVNSSIERLQFKVSVHDTAPGKAVLELEPAGADALKDASAYLCLDLPAHEFGGGTLAVLDGGTEARITLKDSPPSGQKDYLETQGRQVRIAGGRHTKVARTPGCTSIPVYGWSRGSNWTRSRYTSRSARSASPQRSWNGS